MSHADPMSMGFAKVHDLDQSSDESSDLSDALANALRHLRRRHASTWSDEERRQVNQLRDLTATSEGKRPMDFDDLSSFAGSLLGRSQAFAGGGGATPSTFGGSILGVSRRFDISTPGSRSHLGATAAGRSASDPLGDPNIASPPRPDSSNSGLGKTIFGQSGRDTLDTFRQMQFKDDRTLSLAGFAVACAANPDLTSIIESVGHQLRRTLASARTGSPKLGGPTIRPGIHPASGVTVHLALGTNLVTIDGQQRTPMSDTDHPLMAVQEEKHDGVLFADNGNMYLTLRVDDVLYGVACIWNVDETLVDELTKKMAEAVAAIGALSLQMLRQVDAVSAHVRKSTQMLHIASALARESYDDETKLTQGIMDSAKELVEAERCQFFFADPKTGQLKGGQDPPKPVLQAAADRRIVSKAFAPEAMRESPFAEEDVATGHQTASVMCVPLDVEGELIGVAQLRNKAPLKSAGSEEIQVPFSPDDEETIRIFGHFFAVAIRNCRSNVKLRAEKRKADAVLRVISKLAESDIRDVNAVIQTVMTNAKELLSADRASLFLIDEERDELYSKVATGAATEIRFPIGKGIAGTVAHNGVGEVINDPYNDDRFNKAIDKQLGYRTESIATSPIMYKHDVIAVIQLVNKVDSHKRVQKFTADDLATLDTFGMFAGISLGHSRLLEFAINAGQEAIALQEMRMMEGSINSASGFGPATAGPETKSNVIRSVTSEMREKVHEAVLPEAIVKNFTTPDFDLFALRESCGERQQALDAAAKLSVRLIQETGLSAKFGVTERTLTNFVCKCRSLYRQVPYHNFFHAVDTLQTVHTFVFHGKVSEMLTELDCFVLMITALVHDLDHMGLNNNFHLKTDSPLGILSSASGNTSVLEVHHCNMAIEILSDPEANVLANIPENDKPLAYRNMIDCVLATDMARHGALLESFNKTMEEGYRKNSADHRKVLMQLLLKSADISNVTKPFEISRMWAVSVTEEFYKQGDREREKGLDVNPMFDRSLGGELAKGQIGFINFLCLKFFGAVAKGTNGRLQWTIDRVQSNLETWKGMMTE